MLTGRVTLPRDRQSSPSGSRARPSNWPRSQKVDTRHDDETDAAAVVVVVVVVDREGIRETSGLDETRRREIQLPSETDERFEARRCGEKDGGVDATKHQPDVPVEQPSVEERGGTVGIEEQPSQLAEFSEQRHVREHRAKFSPESRAASYVHVGDLRVDQRPAKEPVAQPVTTESQRETTNESTSDGHSDTRQPKQQQREQRGSDRENSTQVSRGEA